MQSDPSTVKQLAPDLFTIGVLLPKTPLKLTNSYLIRGERNLLIDTGFNHPQCEEAMRASLAELEVDMAKTDIFLTHLHSDHTGLAQRLATPETRIFVSEADGKVVAMGRDADFWESFKRFYRFTGLEAGGHVSDVSQHPGFAYAPEAADNYTYVADGDTLQAGDYRLTCVLTKGHTRGHLCLFEAERKLLFSGDHILGRITPNITQMSFDHDALGEFFDSLDRVDALDVDLVLPGHRMAIPDLRARTAELRRHHAARLAEAESLVGPDGATTVDVARGMRWSLTIDNWLDYPPAQKLFSAGEALAHLYHLELRGRLRREERDGVMYFYPARSGE